MSTTHVISSAIMGVGSANGARHVRWGVARSIVLAWIVTIPAAGFRRAGLAGPERSRTQLMEVPAWLD